MSPRPTLTIPQPCHESWAAMTPAAQGRHCAACDKVVVDFTYLTDGEILALLKQAAAPCGRFRPEQLNRPLLVPMAAPRWQPWLAAAAAVVGLELGAAPEARAQFPVRTEQHVITMGMVAVPRRAQPLPLGLPPVVVRGRVTDRSTGDSLPGVTVLLKNTTIGTFTAADGTFELSVPAPAAGQTLVFASIGFVREERSLDDEQLQEMNISLAADTQMLGGLIVTSYTVRKPWPWHPQALWWHLTRPFRR